MDKFDMEITALAIFTDERKSFKPSHYEYNFYETRLRYDYRIFKVLDVPEEKEWERWKENPFSLVILTALEMIKAGSDLSKKLEFKTRLIRKMILSGFPRDKQLALMQFIDVAVTLSPEMNQAMLEQITHDKEIETMEQKHVMGGLEKLIFDQGASKGKIDVVKNMLSKKLPEKLIAEVSGLKKRDIDRLKKQLAV
jgi:hypothetical protein